MNYLAKQLDNALATQNMEPRTQELLVPFLKQFTSLNLPLVEGIKDIKNEEDSFFGAQLKESVYHHGKMWGRVAYMYNLSARLTLQVADMMAIAVVRIVTQ